MNNQLVKGFWKIAEDYPSVDKPYIVVFPNREGGYEVFDYDVWEFSGSGLWRSLPSSRFFEEEVGTPSYYIDLPPPKED